MNALTNDRTERCEEITMSAIARQALIDQWAALLVADYRDHQYQLTHRRFSLWPWDAVDEDDAACVIIAPPTGRWVC